MESAKILKTPNFDGLDPTSSMSNLKEIEYQKIGKRLRFQQETRVLEVSSSVLLMYLKASIMPCRVD